jgi:hypothetical protein
MKNEKKTSKTFQKVYLWIRATFSSLKITSPSQVNVMYRHTLNAIGNFLNLNIFALFLFFFVIFLVICIVVTHHIELTLTLQIAKNILQSSKSNKFSCIYTYILDRFCNCNFIRIVIVFRRDTINWFRFNIVRAAHSQIIKQNHMFSFLIYIICIIFTLYIRLV